MEDVHHECEYKERVAELESQLALLLVRFSKLEAELATTKAELAECKVKLAKYEEPPKDSGNSSTPPSKDPKRKPYPKREKSGAKPGAQMGHKGHYHELYDIPDEVVVNYPQSCTHCGSHEMEETEVTCGEVRQELEIPPVKPFVREYRKGKSRCGHCGKTSQGSFPKEISAPIQMGKTVDSVIAYLKTHAHLSHSKIQDFFAVLLGFSLSEGSVQNGIKRTASRLEETYEGIKDSLKTAPVIHSDETGNKINGKSGYVWVFVSALFCAFESAPSRGFEVIQTFFTKTFPTIWVSDRYGAQLKVDALHQICLAHLIRDCQYLIDAETSAWGLAFKTLLQEAIAFRNQQGGTFEPFSSKTFRPILEFEKRLSQLLAHAPRKPHEKKLFKSLRGRQQQIFLFLRYANVPPTNNEAEQALRNRVIHRKVTGGFRTESGSRYYDIIASVIETARRQGKNILQVLNQKESLLLSS